MSPHPQHPAAPGSETFSAPGAAGFAANPRSPRNSLIDAPASPATQGAGRAGFRSLGLIILAVLILPLAVLSLMVGSRVIEPTVVIDALRNFQAGDDEHLIIRELRLPRTILAVLAGACLGLAGALMQSLTRNALAEPGTLGVNAGAAAGVVLGLAFTGAASIFVYVWFAFLGAGIASVIVHRLGRAGEQGVNPVRLVLAGAGLSVMVQSLTTIMVLADPEGIYDSFRSWMTGSLEGRGWESLPVVAASLLFGAVLCLWLSGPLNSVSLGTDLAASLGVNIRLTWSGTNLAILILAGAATAAVGPIAFVGLAAPHIARYLVGPDHRWLLPYSALIAALVLLLADILGRVVVFPGELGAGIMTALIGAPFFILLVRRGKVAGL
ncbi:Ferric enterobactin transport system permease protein FepD [Corynebacterium occultum]|uniref:Ferric enterobactin transport system permease protein FepD n=1 Tax=Corynebacterium occultum TaxID=2675219 RepID=A0A6B8W6B3_9CORY|nr:iron ABC transporter permease [Corynebacterium occultum]QGU08121.1 Ferric enterobactin transport system permease protein FepD [Corynebacterium occultum]